MKWLIGAACVAAILAGATNARADDTTVLSLVAPYCTYTYTGDAVSKCITDQSNAIVRITALKKVRGTAVDGVLRLCALGQYPEPRSGVDFVGAFKCVLARISSG